MKNYTQEEIQSLQAKADKWDKLETEIASCYAEPEDDDFSEHNGEADLVTIGEIAASAFGWI